MALTARASLEIEFLNRLINPCGNADAPAALAVVELEDFECSLNREIYRQILAGLTAPGDINLAMNRDPDLLNRLTYAVAPDDAFRTTLVTASLAAAMIDASLQSKILSGASTEDVRGLLDAASARLSKLDAKGGGLSTLNCAQLTLLAMDSVDDDSSAQGNRTILTGLADLDRMFMGIRRGEMVVFGARPGCGKSTMLMNIARQALDDGVKTLVVNLEISSKEYARTLTHALSQTERGSLADNEAFERFTSAADRYEHGTLRLLQESESTVEDIVAEATRGEYHLVLVDYLQLMRTKERHSRRDLEIAHATRELKLLATKRDLVVIVASQLNRGPAQRQDKQPSLSDLRESGAIEQDADRVVLIHCEGTKWEMRVAKNRHGKTGKIRVEFDGAKHRFLDISEGW